MTSIKKGKLNLPEGFEIDVEQSDFKSGEIILKPIEKEDEQPKGFKDLSEFLKEISRPNVDILDALMRMKSDDGPSKAYTELIGCDGDCKNCSPEQSLSESKIHDLFEANSKTTLAQALIKFRRDRDEKRNRFPKLVKRTPLKYNDILYNFFMVSKNEGFIYDGEEIRNLSPETAVELEENLNYSLGTAKSDLTRKKLRLVAKELNGDWEPSIDSHNKAVFIHLGINSTDKSRFIKYTTHATVIYDLIYFKSEKLAKQAVDIIGYSDIFDYLSNTQ